MPGTSNSRWQSLSFLKDIWYVLMSVPGMISIGLLVLRLSPNTFYKPSWWLVVAPLGISLAVSAIIYGGLYAYTTRRSRRTRE